MFLATIARPHYNDTGDCTFDRKVGIWPFEEGVAATLASARRPAGSIETKTKPVNVMAQQYREFMIEKVLPAIQLKWPDRDHEINIQQDGASSRIK
jgi:hypothetical protein